MEIFAVLLVAYMVKIVAEDTWHGVKGTPNPRHAARVRRQRARKNSRTWGAISNYWADLVEDATEAATERRRRKAAARRQDKREEKPDEEIQDAEWWEDGDWPDPWEKSEPVAEAQEPAGLSDHWWSCHFCSAAGAGYATEDDAADDHALHMKRKHPMQTDSEATSPAAGPDTNVYPFPNRTEKENNMSDTHAEVYGMDQAINYARTLAGSAAEHGTAGNEGYISQLEQNKVGGETLQSAHDMQEAFANAAAAAERHAELLEEGKAVQEAYDSAPDAGDKEFVTGGR